MQSLTCFILIAIFSAPVCATPSGTAAPSASKGEALFAGTLRFRNGGPPCAACHCASGLPFPNGGALGPDLSRSALKLGPEGLNVVLRTLYFPTMRPVFDSHPLTPEERGNLKAFLDQAQSGPAPVNVVPVLVSIACAGLLVLLVLARGVWRHNLRDRRRSLVHSGSVGDVKP